MAKNKSNSRKKKQKNKAVIYAGLILGLVILTILIYNIFVQFRNDSKVAAIVNGNTITYGEIERFYAQLPDNYKVLMTKNDVLDQKISEMIMLDEAKSSGIEITDEEANAQIDDIILRNNITEGQFAEILAQQGITRDGLKDYYKVQLAMVELLNQTAFKGIKVTDTEMREYYRTSGMSEAGVSYEDSQEQIEMLLLSQKQEFAFFSYAAELRKGADVEIFFGIDTFKKTELEVCKEGGKPIVRMYSKSDCEQCELVSEAFEFSVMPYVQSGKILAYNWELDTGDNKLTSTKETKIPSQHVAEFKTISPKLKVPSFSFGCVYIRDSLGYPDENDTVDLIREQQEFDLILQQIVD